MNQATIDWRRRRGPGERPPVERRDPVAPARRRPLRDRRPLHPCPAPAGARPGATSSSKRSSTTPSRSSSAH